MNRIKALFFTRYINMSDITLSCLSSNGIDAKALDLNRLNEKNIITSFEPQAVIIDDYRVYDSLEKISDLCSSFPQILFICLTSYESPLEKNSETLSKNLKFCLKPADYHKISFTIYNHTMI